MQSLLPGSVIRDPRPDGTIRKDRHMRDSSRGGDTRRLPELKALNTDLLEASRDIINQDARRLGRYAAVQQATVFGMGQRVCQVRAELKTARNLVHRNRADK